MSIAGLFLLAKSTLEIHEKLGGEEGHASAKVSVSFISVIIQIMFLDIIFSLDSAITAVGMVQQIQVMILAIVISVGFMMFVSRTISQFIEQHPTLKRLTLSFLISIGVALVGEGLDMHIPKVYIYFAMAFSMMVEMLNLRWRKRQETPVHLRQPYH